MKKLNTVIFLLIAISFAVIGIMISYMPPEVPTHYNALGEVDGMGSPNTYFIFPAISAVSSLILIPVSKTCTKPEERKTVQYVTVFSVLLFAVLGIFFSYRALVFNPASVSPETSNNVFKLTFIILGLLFVFIGNRMPKVRKNPAIGVRTKWTLASDTVWQKSNRFAAIGCVVCGFLMIICSALLTSPLALLCVNTALVVLWGIASTVASYMYYKKEQQEG